MLSCALAGGFSLAGRSTAALAIILVLALPSAPADAATLDPPDLHNWTLYPTGGAPTSVSEDWGRPDQTSGFLDLEFIHDVVLPNSEYGQLLEQVNPDTLGAYIQHLENYGTRHTNSPQVLHAGRWLVKQLVGFGYSDTLLQQIRREGKEFLPPRNVIARKEGVSKQNFRIVIGGHYDCITYGQPVPPTVEAPGADDDASGTAGTLQIARLLKDIDLDATVEYVLFAGHEQGLYGSLEYVSRLAAEGVPRDKLFFINLDMIGNADSHRPWKVRIYTDNNSHHMARLLERLYTAYTGLVPLVAANRLADQSSFHAAGYPGIFVHEFDFNPGYHSLQDILANLEMDYEAEVVKGVLAMVLHLAVIADPPDAVTAYQTEAGDLRIEWNHSTDADVLGYRVELLDDGAQLLATHSTADNYMMVDRHAADGVSWVRVRAEDVLGESEPSEAAFVGGGEFIVQGATPNPARDECWFDIFVPGAGDPGGTSLKIFDASGRLVRSMSLSRGSQTLKWDTTSADGDPVAPGIYFYTVEVEGIGTKGGKVMVVR